jgi:hypothetical protein
LVVEEVELEDPEGFGLYTPEEGEQDEIDWNEEEKVKEKEVVKPAPVVEVKERLSVS